MNVVMTFKLEWNKATGESLSDFKRKYDSLRQHVEAMQGSMLPHGDVRWVISRAKPAIVLPEAPRLALEGARMPLSGLYAPL